MMQPKHIEYEFLDNGGHGWLKVPRKELYLLGISHQVSEYSYQNKDVVFLEEDADLALFRAAMNQKNIVINKKYIFVGPWFPGELEGYKA